MIARMFASDCVDSWELFVAYTALFDPEFLQSLPSVIDGQVAESADDLVSGLLSLEISTVRELALETLKRHGVKR